MFIQIKKLSYVISLLFLIVHIPYSYTSQVIVQNDPENNNPTIYLNLSNPAGKDLYLKLQQAFLKDKKEGLFEYYNFSDFCGTLSKILEYGNHKYTHKIKFFAFLLFKQLKATDYRNSTDDDHCNKDHNIYTLPFSHLLQELMNYSADVKNLVSSYEKNDKYLLKQGANTNLRVQLLIEEKNQKIEQLDKQLTRLKFIIALCILLMGGGGMFHFYHSIKM